MNSLKELKSVSIIIISNSKRKQLFPKMIKLLTTIYIIVCSTLISSAQSSYFSCRILKHIQEDISSQIGKNLFQQAYKDSIFMVEFPNGDSKLMNLSKLSNAEVYQRLGDTSKIEYFDSDVFKAPNKAIILDTIDFFEVCKSKKNRKETMNLPVVANKSILKKKKINKSILILQSIHVYKNHLVLSFSPYGNSKLLVYFFNANRSEISMAFKKEIPPMIRE